MHGGYSAKIDADGTHLPVDSSRTVTALSKIASSSFAGLFTRVEIGQIVIDAAEYGIAVDQDRRLLVPLLQTAR